MASKRNLVFHKCFSFFFTGLWLWFLASTRGDTRLDPSVPILFWGLQLRVCFSTSLVGVLGDWLLRDFKGVGSLVLHIDGMGIQSLQIQLCL